MRNDYPSVSLNSNGFYENLCENVYIPINGGENKKEIKQDPLKRNTL